jgi:hypothetical protein
MPEIWEEGEGHDHPVEDHENYERFRIFLEIGPSRTASEAARRIGISKKHAAHLAKRYCWYHRAESFDQWQWERLPEDQRHATPFQRKGRRPLITKAGTKTVASVPPSLPPPPPPPVDSLSDPDRTIEPEVVRDVVEKNQDNEWMPELQEYRNTFRAKGKEFLADAESIRQLAKVAHVDLSILWRRRIEALNSNDLRTASRCASEIKDITPAYWKLRDQVRLYIGEARTHWGDAAGINQLLQEAYGSKSK